MIPFLKVSPGFMPIRFGVLCFLVCPPKKRIHIHIHSTFAVVISLARGEGYHVVPCRTIHPSLPRSPAEPGSAPTRDVFDSIIFHLRLPIFALVKGYSTFRFNCQSLLLPTGSRLGQNNFSSHVMLLSRYGPARWG